MQIVNFQEQENDSVEAFESSTKKVLVEVPNYDNIIIDPFVWSKLANM